MDIKVLSVLATLAVFSMKMLGVLFGTHLLDHYQKRGANFLISWSILYIFEIFVMLLLSFWGILKQIPLLACYVSGIALICVYSCKKSRPHLKEVFLPFFKINNPILVGILAAGFIFCIIHSFLFFDSTWDAHTYGMPRIFIWATSGSLFTNMNTLSKNIFVNEWTGELNAIFYRVITQDNISIPFAGVETYIFSILSVYTVSRDAFKRRVSADLLTFILAFLPSTVLISLTCKGDLLAMVSLPLLVLLLVSYWKKGQDDLALLIGIMSVGALGTGARITLLPVVGFIMLLLLADLGIRRRITEIRRYFVVAVPIYLICWSRYILNLIYYGNPFERVEALNEQVRFSGARLMSTIKGLLDAMLNITGETVFTIQDSVWALGADIGVVGIIFILGLIFVGIYLVYSRCTSKLSLPWDSKRIAPLFALIVINILVLAAAMDWFGWSFRYFGGHVFALMAGLILVLDSISICAMSRIVWLFAIVGASVNCLSTMSIAFMPGEVTGSTVAIALNSSELTRRYQFHSGLINDPSTTPNICDIYELFRKDSKVLVCQSTNQMISWVWGDNASNQVTLCLPEELDEYIINDTWDMVIVTTAINGPCDKLEWSLDYINCFSDPNIMLNVYLNVQSAKLYENCFFADQFDCSFAASGLNPFDGEMCWLSENAVIPIKADLSDGFTIRYSAGIDIVPFKDGETPKVEIYLDNKKIWDEQVTYTGEYVVTIPPEIAENRDIHVFRFQTNGAVYQDPSGNPILSIRLKSIEPLN